MKAFPVLAIIAVLLLIGGIEPNPGPIQGRFEIKIFYLEMTHYDLIKYISFC